MAELKLVERGDRSSPEVRDGRLVLETEQEWVVEGPRSSLDSFEMSLPEFSERLGDGVLLLNFRQSVGRFELPYFGEVELVSNKWGENDFNRMLRELTEIAAGLPFAKRLESGLPYERAYLPERPVPYHAFVYLRYVLSESATGEDRLVDALNRILASPHRKMIASDRAVPLEQVGAVSTRGLLQVLSTPWQWQPSGTFGSTHLATALRGNLPERVLEDRRTHTVDTPENRFVLSFLEICRGVIERTRRYVKRSWKSDSLQRQVLRDCDWMARALGPVRAHGMWHEVGPMVQFPAASTVLQRRYGYREVLKHFVRLRMVSRIPLDDEALEDLLGLKDIATLYEIWCFFAVVRAIERLLGPPSLAETPEVEETHIVVPWKLRVAWPDGTELLYNAQYSRSSKKRTSYSVPLRPDIALQIPAGRNRGLHLFDAKFRLKALDLESEDNDATTYERADLYKMHTYRDAIPEARRVFILYPGEREVFFRTRERKVAA